jgi:hypothetical protein
MARLTLARKIAVVALIVWKRVRSDETELHDIAVPRRLAGNRMNSFQDESAAREQGASQGVRKKAEKLKAHLPFRVDSFESELRGFSAFYQLDVLMCDASLPQQYSKFVGRWRHGSALSTRVCRR